MQQIVGSAAKSKGRPLKKSKSFHEGNKEVDYEETEYGLIKRVHTGEVLLSPEMFEDMDRQIRQLSQSKYEI